MREKLIDLMRDPAGEDVTKFNILKKNAKTSLTKFNMTISSL